MSIGRGPIKAAIYFGPPLGMYTQGGFLKFLEREVVPWMNQNEIPSNFHAEMDGMGKTIYHFPDAGTGIEYTAYSDGRCAVHLMCGSSREETLDGLFRFIMRTEKSQKLRINEA